MALVVTLLLLVVITTLAIAFLALTHRETSAVSGAASTTEAEFGAESAAQRAIAQISASYFATNGRPPLLPLDPYRATNLMGPDLMVSIASISGMNRLRPSGLWTNPTPPVYIQTNRGNTLLEDRWYLDLNRNGKFDPSGYLTNVDDNGQVIYDQNQQPIIQWRIGDPQFIGILRDPTKPHGELNPFIARYAFILLPVGRTLDLNWIHNDTKNVQLGPGYTGYFRNQGVGSFEMNLAAFLTDLNPAYWSPQTDPYRYAFTNNPSFGNTGAAFRDALQVLTNRFYQGDKRRLATPAALFAMTGPLGANYFQADFVNVFADGQLAAFGGSAATASLMDLDDITRPWPGADGHKHYFTIHDLLDPVKMPDRAGPDGGIRARLAAASARVNTEDRYTYYRLLAQLGTDSAADPEEKLDLNYVSVGGFHPTNMVPWTSSNQNVIARLGEKPSELFFHNAADRLLTNEFFPYGITNVRLSRVPGQGIPVFTNGSVFINGNSNNPPIYNARVHQLLQLTVNIFEATRTNDQTEPWPTVPTVMRPIFERRSNGDIYIARYQDVTGVDMRPQLTNNWFELGSSPQTTTLSSNAKFYDIPFLFGARKGIPNFNEFTMNTIAHFSRKVEVEKNGLGNNIATNQMFIMSLSNFFMCEMLNSYSNFPNPSLAYPRALEVQVGIASTVVLTNNNGTALVSAQSVGDIATYPALSWTGGAFRLTRTMTNNPLPTSIYYVQAPNGPGFRPFDNFSAINNKFERIQPGVSNRWGISVSNRFLCFLLEPNTGRLLDCHTTARMNTRLDLSRELDNYGRGSASLFARMWDPAAGIENQIRTSSGGNGYNFLNGTEWQDYSEIKPFSTIRAGMDGFSAFLASTDPPTNLFHQAPFSPNVRLLQVTSWEANDPLVHYTVYDLYDTGSRSNSMVARMVPRQPYSIFTNDLTSQLSSLGYQNKRYSPWGGRLGSELPEDFFFADKDPGVYYPDLWDFPTQKFPNAGWLGRVHRGTPWQTIYLKAADPSYDLAAWRAHTGAAYLPQTYPTNDWRLLDIFTAAIHPNATRGRLSINQTNEAAWAAVFGGVPVTAVVGDENTGYGIIETNVQPAAIDWPLQSIIEGINATRNQLPGGQFNRLSEFMAVNSLTLQSPYISNFVFNASNPYRFILADSDYERLPQQILSLVKVGEPRYVIYAWGQSLKPAEYGVSPNGTNVVRNGVGIDQATKTPINYQITGEMATRSVVRVEFEKDAYGRTRYDRPHPVVEAFNILPNE